MRTVATLDRSQHPPVLALSIFDAPHRRMHVSAIVALRDDLHRACHIAGIPTPIEYPIDLSVIFVDPVSPDIGNTYLALEQAMDGATLNKAKAILADDALVSKLTVRRLLSPNSRYDERGKTRRKGSYKRVP